MTPDEVKQAIRDAKQALRGRDLREALARTVAFESSLTPEQLRRMGEQLDEQVDE